MRGKGRVGTMLMLAEEKVGGETTVLFIGFPTGHMMMIIVVVHFGDHLAIQLFGFCPLLHLAQGGWRLLMQLFL